MSGEGARRLGALAAVLGERSLQALLVTAPANVRYLTGYTGSNGAVLASAQAGSVFYTDFRYETQAQQQVAESAPGCAVEIVAGGDLLEAAAGTLLQRSGEAAGMRVGFDERQMSVSRHERLLERLAGAVELVPCGGVVERLREVKDAGELTRIAAACELADEALRQILRDGLVGRTERQVAIDLETRMRVLGAEGASFPTIVASGAHGALPHAQPRAVEMASGDLVTIDWGATLDGYCSDCTRTYAAGEPTPRAREIYELVLEAQLAGLSAVAPGRSGREVDAAAREPIERAGLGERFGHGLGHGVGIEVHEGPRLSKTAGEEPLLEGNVVTVEPGIYLPGQLGVRIEDLVVLEQDGPRVLTSLSKELTVIG